MVPSVSNPQEWWLPADTAENRPPGVLVSPESFEPQQVIVELARTAHEWLSPTATLIAVNAAELSSLSSSSCVSSEAAVVDGLEQHHHVRRG